MMWPYEEYTVLENILILVIPWCFVMLIYFLLRPILFRKISEKQMERSQEDEGQEYW
jgi:hypothetical protein